VPEAKFFLRHENKDVEPHEVRLFPYDTLQEARDQAKHDHSAGLPSTGIVDENGELIEEVNYG